MAKHLVKKINRFTEWLFWKKLSMFTFIIGSHYSHIVQTLQACKRLQLWTSYWPFFVYTYNFFATAPIVLFNFFKLWNFPEPWPLFVKFPGLNINTYVLYTKGSSYRPMVTQNLNLLPMDLNQATLQMVWATLIRLTIGLHFGSCWLSPLKHPMSVSVGHF